MSSQRIPVRSHLNPLMFIVPVVMAVAGCGQSGPQLASVAGSVRLNGQPVPDLLVEFQPEHGGSPSLGLTDDDGNFKLQFSRDKWGALPGRHVVKIDYDADGRQGGSTGTPIPSQYNAQSQLKRNVEPGPNNFNFDLQTNLQAASAQR